MKLSSKTFRVANKMVKHSEIREDPHIKMRTVRVMFDHPAYNFSTEINGTREEIMDYYLGNQFNVGDEVTEIMETPTRLEFTPPEGSDAPVIYAE